QVLVKEDPNLRIVLKDFPVLGPPSVEASQISLAVQKQFTGEKLFAFHTRLMEGRGPANGQKAMALARELGADMTRLSQDVQSPAIGAALAENAELGDKLRLTGTPAFILGKQVIPGAV